jgi:hypothetical protein
MFSLFKCKANISTVTERNRALQGNRNIGFLFVYCPGLQEGFFTQFIFSHEKFFGINIVQK